MTPEEFISLAARVSFGGGASLWHPHVEARPYGGGDLLLFVVIRVPDRENGRAVEVGFQEPIRAHHLWALEREEDAKKSILDLVNRALLHELSESVRWDGAIARDPHVGG